MAATAAATVLGTSAPDFRFPATDGKTYAWSDIAGSKGTVIVFICNHCPYVKAVIDRLVTDARTLIAEGFGFVAVCSNDAKAYPDLEEFWSLRWKTPPPENCIEQRLGHAHLTWIFVNHRFAGHGIGSALLAHASNHLIELGYTELISSFILRTAGTNSKVWPTMRTRPAWSAVVASSIASWAARASGFSTKTCLPAARARTVSGAWLSWRVAVFDVL